MLKSHHLTHLKTTLKAPKNTIQEQSHSRQEHEQDFLIRPFQHRRSLLQFHKRPCSFRSELPHLQPHENLTPKRRFCFSPNSDRMEESAKSPWCWFWLQLAYLPIFKPWPIFSPHKEKYPCTDFAENSYIICFLVNLLLPLQDEGTYGNKLWGMNLKGSGTIDRREQADVHGQNRGRTRGTPRPFPSPAAGQTVVRAGKRKPITSSHRNPLTGYVQSVSLHIN